MASALLFPICVLLMLRVLRERLQTTTQWRAVAVVDRLTTAIVVVPPVLATAALPVVAPGYLPAMATGSAGIAALSGAVLAQIALNFSIKKIIDFFFKRIVDLKV